MSDIVFDKFGLLHVEFQESVSKTQQLLFHINVWPFVVSLQSFRSNQCVICRRPESFVFVMSPLKTFLFSCWAADPSIQIYQNVFITPLSREFPINFIFARLLLQMVAPNYCQTPDYLKPSSCQIAADKNKTHIAKYGVFRRRCTIIIKK